MLILLQAKKTAYGSTVAYQHTKTLGEAKHNIGSLLAQIDQKHQSYDISSDANDD